MVQRTRTRMTWQSKRVRAGHHPSIGRGIEVVDSADKGRIVVANTTFRRKESILREPPLPLAMFGPGHCFRCAAGILRVNPDGTPPRMHKASVRPCQVRHAVSAAGGYSARRRAKHPHNTSASVR